MKTLFLMFLGTALTAYGQPRGASPGTQTQDTEISSIGRPADRTAGMPTGIARINGTLYYIRNNQATVATGPLRVGDSLRLEGNGALLLGDGRRVLLTEGQMVTEGGDIVDTPRNVELPRRVGPTSDLRRLSRRPSGLSAYTRRSDR